MDKRKFGVIILQNSTIELIDQKAYKLKLKGEKGANEKSLYILHSKVKKCIQEKEDKKDTGEYDVRTNDTDVNVHETEQWAKDFTELTAVTFK